MASFPTSGSYRLRQFKVYARVHTAAFTREVSGEPVLAQFELPIQGMTCAYCASRIEPKMNKLDGVSATVNGATEKARVAHDPAVVFAATVRSLVRAVLRERQ